MAALAVVWPDVTTQTMTSWVYLVKWKAKLSRYSVLGHMQLSRGRGERGRRDGGKYLIASKHVGRARL